MGNGDLARLAGKLRWALPRGQTLPHEVWQQRHRGLLALLWLHALALPVFAVLQGQGVLHSVAEGAIPAALAALAHAARHRRRFS